MKGLVYEAGPKSLLADTSPCKLVVWLVDPDLCTPIGQRWYQVIGKQKKPNFRISQDQHTMVDSGEAFGTRLVPERSQRRDTTSPEVETLGGRGFGVVPDCPLPLHWLVQPQANWIQKS